MVDNVKKVLNNSHMLILFEARKCNPNGNFDDDNKPRIDYYTQHGLISDSRWKRNHRNYVNIYEKGEFNKIFIIEGEKNAAFIKNNILESEENILKYFWDNRVFGYVYAKANKDKNNSSKDERKKAKDSEEIETVNGINEIGPVQFSWGETLHKVEINYDNATITCISQQEDKKGNAIGKKYFIYYGLYAIDGIVVGKRAEETLMNEEDLEILDRANVRCLKCAATTSKYGQTLKLYLRVEMKDNNTFLNNLTNYIDFDAYVDEIEIRSYKDYSIRIDRLVNYLKENKELVNKIIIKQDNLFNIKYDGNLVELNKIFVDLGFAVEIIE